MTGIDKTNTLSFAIAGIQVIESCLFELKQPLGPNEQIDYELTIEQKVHSTDHLFNVICRVVIIHKNTSEELARFSALCGFIIENIDDFYVKETKEHQFPIPILTMFNSVTISTVRGMMVERFRGTHLHGCVLPVVDPKTITGSN